MVRESRKKKTVRNIIFSLLSQFIILICTFLTRTIFIRCLGASYLGINGLFTNILTVLSIADLGFDTAVIYSLYKPIAENDKKKISALMQFYKKVYVVIGLSVGFIGLLIVPFLGKLINLSKPIPHITLYYLLYLIDTVSTYMLANRVAIINADQKMYIVKRYTLFFKIAQAVLQIISLLIFKNFIIYLVIQIVVTLMTNLYGLYISNKMYPYIYKENVALSKKERKKIFDNVKSMFIYRIGGVILNNTDNILISVIITTEMVGYYGNYLMISNAINGVVSLVFSSMTASIGNLNAEDSSIEKKENTLYLLDFLAKWVYGFCGIMMFVLCGDFIRLMWGTKYVLSQWLAFALILNFLIVGFLHPLRLYRETTGVFRDVKYIFIWTSILNIIFSIILGNILVGAGNKLFGIIFSTALARLLTTVWFEPKKIFNLVFKKKVIPYYLRVIKDIVIFLVIILICYVISSLIISSSWFYFFIKMFVCFILSNVLYIIFYYNTVEFKFYFRLVKKIQRKIFKKRRYLNDIN